MRNSIFLILLCFVLGLAMTSCKSDTKQPVNTETTPQPAERKGKEFTSAYICPMYCTGSGSKKPGKCSVCRMDYVANDKIKKPNGHEGHDHGHDHDHSHDGHDHSGHNH